MAAARPLTCQSCPGQGEVEAAAAAAVVLRVQPGHSHRRLAAQGRRRPRQYAATSVGSREP